MRVAVVRTLKTAKHNSSIAIVLKNVSKLQLLHVNEHTLVQSNCFIFVVVHAVHLKRFAADSVLDKVEAVSGFCDGNCQNFIYFIILFSFLVFIHSTSEVGSMLLIMRCTDPKGMYNVRARTIQFVALHCIAFIFRLMAFFFTIYHFENKHIVFVHIFFVP